MIRLALLAIGFLGITVALIVFQPGSNRRASPELLPEPSVTRAEPAFEAAPEPTGLQPIQDMAGLTPVVPSPAPAASLGDEELRRMTWSTLSNLNTATGRDSAPGQPGSLLHTIVRRSLDDQSATPQISLDNNNAQIYVVQPGDSLVAIAERLYGDVNMTGPLFAANQAVLSRPDDLRPGLALVLPAK